MQKTKRKRNKLVNVRLSTAEYTDLLKKVAASGLTQQAYILNAIRGATIVSSEEVAVLKDLSRTFAEHERQLRGLATNVNQMAHVANGQGILPTQKDLNQIMKWLVLYRKENEILWQSIRSLIGGHRPTVR